MDQNLIHWIKTALTVIPLSWVFKGHLNFLKKKNLINDFENERFRSLM